MRGSGRHSLRGDRRLLLTRLHQESNANTQGDQPHDERSRSKYDEESPESHHELPHVALKPTRDNGVLWLLGVVGHGGDRAQRGL